MRARLMRFAALLLAVPSLAWAQLLDFDTVCAVPPCAIGTLYAASGVGFQPSTNSIVAGASGGLTGTNGAKYLSVAAAPFDVTITLARRATFLTLNLSRANTSSGAFTVTMTALSSGTPVASAVVTLTAVNTWSTAAVSAAGGFDSVLIDANGAANMTFGIDNVQVGGNCYGFADVTSADSFCNAVEWLANRSVTLGCGAGQYCPSQAVTRAAMALFMQRLGTAVAPVFLSTAASASGDFQTSVNTCVSGPYQVQGYPRTAHATAALHAYFPDGLKTLLAHIGYSEDGGATYTFTGASFSQSIDPGHTATWLDLMPPVALAPGRSYRFAVQITGTTFGGASATATISVECKLLVRIDAANPTAAPYDAAAPVP